MSVAQLHRPDRVADVVSSARAAVRSAAELPAISLTTDELTDGIAGLASLEAQAGALRLSLLAEADRRKIAQSLGSTGTDAWAARLTGANRAETANAVRLARLLRDTYDATREAFAAGAINQDQARVIVHAAEQLPAAVTEQHRRAAEAGLVARAVTGTDARRLRQAGRRMLEDATAEITKQEATRLADEHEAVVLTAEERRAEVETWFSLGDNGNGTWSGRFVIPELHGQLLRGFLEQFTSPRRLTRNRAGESVRDASVAGAEDGGLSWTEKLGLGLTELIEHLPSEAAGGFARNAVTLLVHLDHQHLLDGLASARLDTGAHVSAGEARRLACGAGIIPLVLGGASQVLDLGRERRLHSTAQRRALSATHETCAAEGCERPFAWCDVHHPRAWSHGGATDLDNAVPLCGFHHRRAHDARFDLTTLTSGEVRYRRRR
ncbi:HNH endonuclease signature motif containing protein [soil metagenome]